MNRFLIVLVFFLSGTAGAAESPVQGFDEGLQEGLQPLLAQASANGLRLSVGVADLSGAFDDQTLLLGSEASYAPASTIKLLLIAALMQQVDAGRLRLSDTVPVDPDDIVGGMGLLQNEPTPQQVSLQRLAELTITVSDNTATNVLVDVVGYQAMAALAEQLQLQTMQFGRKMFEAAQPPEKDNYIDVRDSLQLLSQIYQGDFLGEESRAQILAWMSAQTVKSKIGAGVPEGVLVAHKTGENGPLSHDMGYLLIPGREVALAIFAETSNTTDFNAAQAELNPVVADIAARVYRALVR